MNIFDVDNFEIAAVRGVFKNGVGDNADASSSVTIMRKNRLCQEIFVQK